ncbi:MAG: 16S rRNA processing protein RimM [Erysipelotrichaceae bacterium]|nr:16S rRNA processing protein RimM [Erysipelotrichaceae bacterium]
MEKVVIGTIVNTRGLKGELKIMSSTSFPEERFKVGNKLTLVNPLNKTEEEVVIARHFVFKNFDFLVFKGKEDINLVEKYKNWHILADKKELGENDFYYSDLKGLDVYFNNQLLGKIKEVFDLNNRSMLRIKKIDNKELLVIFMDEFIDNVDLENKKITLKNIEGLL